MYQTLFSPPKCKRKIAVWLRETSVKVVVWLIRVLISNGLLRLTMARIIYFLSLLYLTMPLLCTALEGDGKYVIVFACPPANARLMCFRLLCDTYNAQIPSDHYNLLHAVISPHNSSRLFYPRSPQLRRPCKRFQISSILSKISKIFINRFISFETNKTRY